MIISAAPFRVSFAGGGSDLPAYYQRRRGAVLSVTIDKYLYISVHPYFHSQQTLLKYSQSELVSAVSEIRHPILREVLSELWPQGGVEVVSTADVPSGTGLGSSSTFTVALLNALYALRGEFRPREELARKACEIEIDRLSEPIGKQDQYAAACGGLNVIEFDPSGSVRVDPLILNAGVLAELESSLHLFYTGDQRDARSILEEQSRSIGLDTRCQDTLTRMVEMCDSMREQLSTGDLEGFGANLNLGWQLKKTLASKISNPRVDALYEGALYAGALGGKLLGAGGHGFLLLFCPRDRHARVRGVMEGCFEMPFRFESGGARIVHVGDGNSEAGFVR